MKRSLLFIGSLTILFTLLSTLPITAQIKLGGYVQTWMIEQQRDPVAHHPGVPESDWGFRVRRARLNASEELSSVFSLESWFEFSGADGKVLLDFKGLAKIDPLLNITVGQFIPPTQMLETSSLSSGDMALYELSDISIGLSNAMKLDSYRDVGVQIAGTESILSYRLYLGNGQGRNLYAIVSGSSGASQIANRKFGQGLLGGRIDIEPVKGLSFGAHYASNVQDSVNVTTASPAISSVNVNSYSANVYIRNLASLPGVLAMLEYGKWKNDVTNISANGIVAMLGYNISEPLQVVFRYDNMTTSKPNAADYKNNNTTVGINYLFFKPQEEGKSKSTVDIVRLGLNYEIRSESPTSTADNVGLLWAQFRF